MRIAGTNIIPASYCDDPEVPFAPQIERIGFLVHPETPASFGMFKFAEALIPAPKVKLVALGVHDADEIERALAAFAAKGNGGIIVIPHGVTLTNRDLIVALAARLRLPALYPLALYAEAGGLISYGCPRPFGVLTRAQRALRRQQYFPLGV